MLDEEAEPLDVVLVLADQIAEDASPGAPQAYDAEGLEEALAALWLGHGQAVA